MAEFNQNHTPIDGPWVETEQSHDEYVRRTSDKGATPGGRDATERHRRTAEAAHRYAGLLRATKKWTGAKRRRRSTRRRPSSTGGLATARNREAARTTQVL